MFGITLIYLVGVLIAGYFAYREGFSFEGDPVEMIVATIKIFFWFIFLTIWVGKILWSEIKERYFL